MAQKEIADEMVARGATGMTAPEVRKAIVGDKYEGKPPEAPKSIRQLAGNTRDIATRWGGQYVDLDEIRPGLRVVVSHEAN